MRRPSPKLVPAGAALFIALNGTTYAATQINGNQIWNGTVGTLKIRSGAITPRSSRTPR